MIRLLVATTITKMEYIFGTAFFLLGLIIGSFLNVVILRYRTGRTVLGRSACFSCGVVLTWQDLIPVFSFLAIGGKCRSCGSKISIQYPLVEFLTGFIFLAVFCRAGFGTSPESLLSLVYFLIIWSLLTVILVYDFKHKIIPSGFVYTFAILALINFLATTPIHLIWQAAGIYELLAGPILFLPFFLVWYLSRGRMMGLGDGKLALGIGWMLGLAKGGTAIILGFWIGAVVSVVILLLSKLGLSLDGKPLTIKSEVPFAPFLILGVLIVFLTEFNLFVIGL